jgi:hypothetical protein
VKAQHVIVLVADMNKAMDIDDHNGGVLTLVSVLECAVLSAVDYCNRFVFRSVQSRSSSRSRFVHKEAIDLLFGLKLV